MSGRVLEQPSLEAELDHEREAYSKLVAERASFPDRKRPFEERIAELEKGKAVAERALVEGDQKTHSRLDVIELELGRARRSLRALESAERENEEELRTGHGRIVQLVAAVEEKAGRADVERVCASSLEIYEEDVVGFRDQARRTNKRRELRERLFGELARFGGGTRGGEIDDRIKARRIELINGPDGELARRLGVPVP